MEIRQVSKKWPYSKQLPATSNNPHDGCITVSYDLFSQGIVFILKHLNIKIRYDKVFTAYGKFLRELAKAILQPSLIYHFSTVADI